MPPRDWTLRIDDIIDAIKKIRSYTKNMNYETFARDPKTLDAVITNFMVIGEAVRHIPDDILADHPEIAWHKMRGMRNVIAHSYFQIDDKVIWEASQADVAELLPKMIELKSKID